MFQKKNITVIWLFEKSLGTCIIYDITHRIHVWYMYLHLVDFHGTSREIYVQNVCVARDFSGAFTGKLKKRGKRENFGHWGS